MRPTDGGQSVELGIVSAGRKFPKGSFIRDPFMIHVRNEKAEPDRDPWPPVRLREDRALWRDSLALISSLADQSSRPAVVDWVARLALSGALSRSDMPWVSVFGTASSQAKVLLWRHERLPLPLRYLVVCST